MIQHQNDGITWFQFNIFKNYDGLITHGIFTRNGGVSQGPFATWNAGSTVGDDPVAFTENYTRIRAILPGHPQLVSAIPAQHTDIIKVTAESLDEKETPVFILPRHVDERKTVLLLKKS